MNLFLPLLVGLLFLLGLLLTNLVKDKSSLSNFAVSLAFVVLLGLILFDLIPEIKEIYSINSIKNYNLLIVLIIVILGIMILNGLDKFIPDHHHDHHDNEKNHKEHNSHLYHIGLVTLISLLIHNTIEGMAIYIVCNSDLKSGILMALGVGLHNIPLGIEISATMLDNVKEKKNIIYLIALSISSFIGALIVLLFGEIKEYYLGYIIALTLGMCIYIALFELLKEVITERKKKATLIGLATGILVVLLMVLI